MIETFMARDRAFKKLTSLHYLLRHKPSIHAKQRKVDFLMRPTELIRILKIVRF